MSTTATRESLTDHVAIPAALLPVIRKAVFDELEFASDNLSHALAHDQDALSAATEQVAAATALRDAFLADGPVPAATVSQAARLALGDLDTRFRETCLGDVAAARTLVEQNDALEALAAGRA